MAGASPARTPTATRTAVDSVAVPGDSARWMSPFQGYYC